MNHRYARREGGRNATRPLPPKTDDRKDPLSEARYRDLLSKAVAFFAQAQRDVQSERADAMAEILRTLQRYGLTVEDLR